MIILSGCDYFPPYTDIYKAGEYKEEKDYEKAISHFEIALEKLSRRNMYQSIEFEERYSYGGMLNDYAKLDNPEYILIAREQFEWIRANPIKGKETIYARALSNLANTYQQEAGYTEDEVEVNKLLEKASLAYENSVVEMAKNDDWKNIAYTYYNLGETAEWYGDYPQAIDWLEKAVHVNKKHGFDKNLIEDQEYLDILNKTHRKILNNSIQPSASASAD